jgi:hypothetical protein
LNSIMLMNRIRTDGAHDGPYLMMSTGKQRNSCTIISPHFSHLGSNPGWATNGSQAWSATQCGLPTVLRHGQPLKVGYQRFSGIVSHSGWATNGSQAWSATQCGLPTVLRHGQPLRVGYQRFSGMVSHSFHKMSLRYF